MLINIIFDSSDFISGTVHTRFKESLIFLDIVFCHTEDFLYVPAIIKAFIMLQSAFAGKLILLKKFLNHIGKYKFKYQL